MLLWNVVPTHPGTRDSNRRPTSGEVTRRASVPRRADPRASRRRGRPGRRVGARRAVCPPSVARRRGRRSRQGSGVCSPDERPIAAPVRRNAFLLAGGLVCNSGMFQLAAALELAHARRGHRDHGNPRPRPCDLPRVGRDRRRAGRPADGPRRPHAGDPRRLRVRRPRLRPRRGQAARCRPAAVVAVGLSVLGGAGGVIQLTRAAAAEMFPPERRARGMSFVLFGAVSGAVWGPVVFGPLFAHRAIDAHGLVGPWLVGIPFMVVGFGIMSLVRPDPKETRGVYTPSESSRRPPRRCARSCAGRVCRRRCSPSLRASRSWRAS